MHITSCAFRIIVRTIVHRVQYIKLQSIGANLQVPFVATLQEREASSSSFHLIRGGGGFHHTIPTRPT